MHLAATCAKTAKPAIQRYDAVISLVALSLLIFGLIMVASASLPIAARNFADPLEIFKRQALFALLGVLAALLVTRLPMRFWQCFSAYLLMLGMLLLVLVLWVGVEVNGSTRWLRISGLNGQPSEIVKLFVIVYLAGYLVRHQQRITQSAAAFVYPMLVLLALALLLIAEPDFGAAVILLMTACGMLFLGGAPLLCFSIGILALLLLLITIAILEPYRIDRLLFFVDPFADPYDKGFQLVQALIAIGRGGWFGNGLGESIQKLFYLPEAYTDFLLAVIAEELGLCAVVLVIGLFFVLVVRGFAIASRAQRAGNAFNAFVAYGLVLLIGLQAFINIGVNLGVLPTKGLTLPLMSYGGSSLISYCLMIGMLLRINYETRLAEAAQ